MIGTVLGKYRIEAELSRGGMGAVYRAKHEIIDRTVAIKLLRPELTENQDLVTRFINEAKAASAIRHPSIIEVLDFGYTDDQQAYLVMEFLDGESLAARIAARQRLSEREAIEIVRGIASALTAAHAKGIVHRDLKPDNVMLVPDPDLGERVKVLDFGVAKLIDAAQHTQHTQTGALMGTPMYMAPEQAKSASAIDYRADLYSLGCIFYELLVGQPPFVGEGIGEIIALQMFTPPEPPSTHVPGLSPQLESIVLRLLEKEPDARFASAADLASALAGMADVRPVAPAARAQPSTITSAVAAASLVNAAMPVARAPRNMLPIVAGGIVLALAAIAVLVLVVSRDDAAPARAVQPIAAPPIPRQVVAPAPPAPPPVVPVTPVEHKSVTPVSSPPRPTARPARPKRLPVTENGSPYEPSLD